MRIIANDEKRGYFFFAIYVRVHFLIILRDKPILTF